VVRDGGGREVEGAGELMGRGGLSYVGDDVAPYKRSYEMKGKEDLQAWARLIQLCKLLKATPAENLEKALEPVLDFDGTLGVPVWGTRSSGGQG